MLRDRLSNRRASETVAFAFRGQSWTAGFSRFDDGRIAEIFLTAPKAGTDQAHAAIDAAVVCSIALQYGADLATIRCALIHEEHGDAAGPLGAALAAIDEDFV